MRFLNTLSRSAKFLLPLVAVVVLGVALGGMFDVGHAMALLPHAAPLPMALALVAPLVIPKTKAQLDAPRVETNPSVIQESLATPQGETPACRPKSRSTRDKSRRISHRPSAARRSTSRDPAAYASPFSRELEEP